MKATITGSYIWRAWCNVYSKLDIIRFFAVLQNMFGMLNSILQPTKPSLRCFDANSLLFKRHEYEYILLELFRSTIFGHLLCFFITV